MPKIGEIRKAKELGYKSSAPYIYRTCPTCGKQNKKFTVKGDYP